MSSGMSHYEMWQMGTYYSEKHTTSINYLAKAEGCSKTSIHIHNAT